MIPSLRERYDYRIELGKKQIPFKRPKVSLELISDDIVKMINSAPYMINSNFCPCSMANELITEFSRTISWFNKDMFLARNADSPEKRRGFILLMDIFSKKQLKIPRHLKILADNFNLKIDLGSFNIPSQDSYFFSRYMEKLEDIGNFEKFLDYYSNLEDALKYEYYENARKWHKKLKAFCSYYNLEIECFAPQAKQ